MFPGSRLEMSFNFPNVGKTVTRTVANQPVEDDRMQHVKLGMIVFREMERVLQRLVGAPREVCGKQYFSQVEHGSRTSLRLKIILNGIGTSLTLTRQSRNQKRVWRLAASHQLSALSRQPRKLYAFCIQFHSSRTNPKIK
jgi:hypothetical protein